MLEVSQVSLTLTSIKHITKRSKWTQKAYGFWLHLAKRYVRNNSITMEN